MARVVAVVVLAGAATAIAARAQEPPVHVRTLGSTGHGPGGNSELASATFYGRVSSPGPVAAWFEYQVGCEEAFGHPDSHSHPVRATSHRAFGSARGGRNIQGLGHGLPVMESSCYRVAAEVKGSEQRVYGAWRIQPNFGPHGGPSPQPLPKDPNS